MANSNIEITKIDDLIIIDDYFNFDLHDIILNKILVSFNELNISKEQFNQIFSKFNDFLKNLDITIQKTSSPYLKNCTNMYLNDIESPELKKLFLLLLIGHRFEIFEIFKKFFYKIIKFNHYGLSSNNIKNIFQNDVLESKEFDTFINNLSIWYSFVEFILFYLQILSTFYGENFNFNENKFSIDKNFKVNKKSLYSKIVLQLSSVLCSKLNLDPKIDYSKLILFFALSLQTGFSLNSLFSFFPKNKLGEIFGTFALNFIFGKIATNLNYQSKFVEFRQLSNSITTLNKSLEKIDNVFYELLKMHMIEDINMNIEGSMCNFDEIKETIKKLSTKANKILENIDFDEDVQKKIEEEYYELEEIVKTKNVDDDWVMMYIQNEDDSKSSIDFQKNKNNNK